MVQHEGSPLNSLGNRCQIAGRKPTITLPATKTISIYHLLQDVQQPAAKDIIFLPRLVMADAYRGDIVYCPLPGKSASEILTQLIDKIDMSDITVIKNSQTNSIRVNYRGSEQLAIEAMGTPLILDGVMIEAQLPIKCTEKMTFVTVECIMPRSRTEMAHMLTTILEPYGTIHDIHLKMIVGKIQLIHTGKATVVLDHTDNTRGDIPSNIETEDSNPLWMFRHSVAPYCIYCHKEGHVQAKCALQPKEKQAKLPPIPKENTTNHAVILIS
ncbi:hypothetical protein COEREDRAFT_11929 [Coemansia reversa NRRL 1564]|uniref:CCHC-type domain-containing protein n=1 Tax=Coemansia reversa (strain ATCC 12441 / NRRL 1564) TaxID=763665 RepID=A0A2G5B1T4_COERN|nr:hypothetical protein COEREDRAFT_11929 [Coemansia reversa NRRL 1564]|eukprot:PIA12951.1 hypothetical protein COEREDRAFT_11929 [Coemansia reversa NRRL 1564]